MKLIELLNKIANDTLEDNTRVIIEEELYLYDKVNKRLYQNYKSNSVNMPISSSMLNEEVIIVDKIETEQNNKIEELDGDVAFKDSVIVQCYTVAERKIVNKINEIIRVVNKR